MVRTFSFHIMHPDKHTSLLDAEHGSHQRSLHSLRGHPDDPDDRLAAASQQQGIAEHIQFFQTVDDLQIVLISLAEAHTGIYTQTLFVRLSEQHKLFP